MSAPDQPPTLALFDIDGTLINTLGAGIKAVQRAGHDLFGPAFSADLGDYAGRLDPVIFRELLDAHGLPCAHTDVQRFRTAYARHLPEAIDGSAEACPGVHALLDALEAHRSVTLGLLTGNYPETGSIKLRACSVNPDRFLVRVWSSDAPGPEPRREDLPPIGLERWRASASGPSCDEPHRAVVIGDTPRDIACARANGCRSIGVATGHFDLRTLREAGADLAVETLEETDRLVAWMRA